MERTVNPWEEKPDRPDLCSGQPVRCIGLKPKLISSTVASNGTVEASWLLFGTHKGSVGRLAPTNRKITLPGCDVIPVENGKVKSVRGYFDPEDLLRQLQ